MVDPAFLHVPEYAYTLGPEVAEIADIGGFPPDDDQAAALNAIFGRDKRGLSVAYESAVIASRQNIKTGLFKMVALGWLFVTDERLVVWSAHEFSTTQEAFRDLTELIEGTAVLRRRVKHIYTANGSESIELVGDRRLIFKARTKSGGRGLTGDKIVLDEGFALQPMHMGALLPTLSARPDPQLLYGSSAGLQESGILRGVRDRGRAGNERRLVYIEWCAPPPAQACEQGDACTHALDAVGCGCDDPEMWAQANPALGRRISVETIAAERRALPPLEFARERMGWWDDPLDGESPIKTLWPDLADRESQIEGSLALAVDIAPDTSATSIGVGGRRADALEHGELIEHRRGTAGVVQRLVQLGDRWNPCALVLDPAGPAGALIPALNEAGYVTDPVGEQRRLHLVSAREYAQSCGALADSVKNGRFRHRDQPPLNAAVNIGRTRPLADAWAWTRKESGDISPLVTVTLARLGHAMYGVTAPVAPFVIVGD